MPELPLVRLRAVVAWALILGLPNQVAIASRSEKADVLRWLSHHALDLGQMLLLGLATGALAEVVARRVPERYFARYVVVFVVSLLFGALLLPTSFAGFADRSSELLPYSVVSWGLVVATCATVPVLVWLGSRCKTLWLAGPALAASFGAAWLNNVVLDQDYFGLHDFLAFDALALGGSALFAYRPRFFEQPLPRSVELGALAALSAVALASFLFPSNRMLLRLSSLEGAPIARLSASFRLGITGSEDAHAAVRGLPEARRRWFEKDREDVPPSAKLLPDAPIVILLTIDCMRADVFEKKQKDSLAYFRELGKRSVWFTRARAAGSATVPSLTAMFSGRHYSQLVWKRLSKGGDVWPQEDPSVRFPELLQHAGIPTATVATKSWLTNERGVVRGFDEQTDLDKNRKPRTNHVKLREVLPLLKERLERAQEGPLFFYAHIMDPHSPYDTGKRKKGKVFDRYVSELEQVGVQLGKFDDWLKKQGLFERTTLIITADHGEAFGEHATWQHSKTVYDELIRVPLWVRIPGVKPRRVDEPVSLIDLGPTLLDLFGQPTPGTFMGQSLVPLLRGEEASLTRPIAAEGRLIQTMIFPDGKKAIYDQRRGTFELYDLEKDPRESENLAEDGSSEYTRLLRAFFQTHKNPVYPDHAPYRN